MSDDFYLRSVIGKYRVNENEGKMAAESLNVIINNWAGSYLIEKGFSGSLAKGTAISLSTDADVFLSLSSTTPITLEEMYNSLYVAIQRAGYSVRKQNVSIRVSVGRYRIDLVPGRRQSQYGDYHSLYKYKKGTWTQTNIDVHISHVKDSNRIEEIKLAKIWRELYGLDFPSFYLEMAVIDALWHSRGGQLASNFRKVLEFFGNELIRKRYIDPANTNNIISDDLTESEKNLIAEQAKLSARFQDFHYIVQ